MNGTYVGRLSADDPVHGLLARVARDRMGVRGHDDSYSVFRLSGSHEVYCYEGRSTSTRIIGKFFGPRFGWDRDRAAWMANREYESLRRLRGYGLSGSPHHVVRPHNRTANGATVDFDVDCAYLGHLLGVLRERAHRAVGRRRALVAVRPVAGAPADVAGPAGLAARRRHPGQLPVRPRPGRRGDPSPPSTGAGSCTGRRPCCGRTEEVTRDR
jgi:hypothetical protein